MLIPACAALWVAVWVAIGTALWLAQWVVRLADATGRMVADFWPWLVVGLAAVVVCVINRAVKHAEAHAEMPAELPELPEVPADVPASPCEYGPDCPRCNGGRLITQTALDMPVAPAEAAPVVTIPHRRTRRRTAA